VRAFNVLKEGPYAHPGCIFMRKYRQNRNIVKYYYNLKYFTISASLLQSSVSYNMILRNHCNMLIWCSRNISYYYHQWEKQLCCLFLWKLWLLFSNFKRAAFIL